MTGLTSVGLRCVWCVYRDGKQQSEKEALLPKLPFYFSTEMDIQTNGPCLWERRGPLLTDSISSPNTLIRLADLSVLLLVYSQQDFSACSDQNSLWPVLYFGCFFITTGTFCSSQGCRDGVFSVRTTIGWLQLNLIQIFIIPRGWILLTLVNPWVFPQWGWFWWGFLFCFFFTKSGSDKEKRQKADKENLL